MAEVSRSRLRVLFNAGLKRLVAAAKCCNGAAERFIGGGQGLLRCFFVAVAVLVLNILIFYAPQVPEIVSNLADQSWTLPEQILRANHPQSANLGTYLIAILAVLYCTFAVFYAALSSLGPTRNNSHRVAYILASFTLLSAVGIIVGNQLAGFCEIFALVVLIFGLATGHLTLNIKGAPYFHAVLTDYEEAPGSGHRGFLRNLLKDPVRVSYALAAIGGVFGLTVFFDDIGFSRFVSTWPIIYVGVGFWALVLTLLFVELPRSLKKPPLHPLVVVVPVFLWIIVCSYFNDDHRLPILSTVKPTPQRSPDSAKFPTYVTLWLNAHCPPKATASCPVTFVAAQGGGQRALYWTAAVLARLHDENPQFDKSLFAFSGVSGGAIGGVAYFLMQREADKERPGYWTAPKPQLSTDPRLKAEQALNSFASQDNLAPIIGAFVFRDSLHLLFPFKIDALDRARFFEAGLEKGWSDALDLQHGERNLMKLPFPDALPSSGPAVFLNSTMVANGKRVVDASVDLEPSAEREWMNLRTFKGGLETGPIAMSTAAHLSARFAYVNPHATVYYLDHHTPFGRLVDGGYNDATGLTTLLDVLDAFNKAAQKCQAEHMCTKRIARTVLYISNDPTKDGGLDGTPAQTSASPTPSPTPSKMSVSPTSSENGRAYERSESEHFWELTSPIDAGIQADFNAKETALYERIGRLPDRKLPDGDTVQTISLQRMIAEYSDGGSLPGAAPTPLNDWCQRYSSWKPELGWWLSSRSFDQMNLLLSTGAMHSVPNGNTIAHVPLLDYELRNPDKKERNNKNVCRPSS